MTDSYQDKNISTDSPIPPEGQTILPMIPLRDMVVFPQMVVPLLVGRKRSIDALTDAMVKDRLVFLAAQKHPDVDEPPIDDVYTTGTVAQVLQLLKLPDGSVKTLVEGKERARLHHLVEDDAFYRVAIVPVEQPPKEITNEQIPVLSRSVLDAFAEYAQLNSSISPDLLKKLASINHPGIMSDAVIPHFPFSLENRQTLLETIPMEKRLTLLLKLIRTEIELFRMNQKIQDDVKEHIEKTQKAYYLNEQIRAIRKEMGSEDDIGDELESLEKQIKSIKMSKEATQKVGQEFKRLKQMTPMSAEANVVRTYIDWIISLPWNKKTRLKSDLVKAEQILNEHHYGLEKPKQRILEYLAVQTLVKKVRGPILCLVGPPGVGKTSLAKSTAEATGRKFIRVSLGGVRDEAEIRGHRRTYIGAMPGKIIQSIKKAGANNPLFCLDEIDKMSMDFRGDPSAALLEVLDPEQNNTFNDHYIDMDYDLSDVMFITTANTLPDIPPPLQDRMEIIRIAGYTEPEKYNIAQKFLLPRQIERNGLSKLDVTFSKNALLTIIRSYTREAGVRNLEREIASVLRKIALEVLKNPNTKKFHITETSIAKYLGPIQFRHGSAENKDTIGTATGLAWTQVGGELLSVETLVLPGKGQLLITGKLGDVMKESAQAATSFIRMHAKELGIMEDIHKDVDLHIHVPEGATPKDGPSAGITMCTAMVSALTRRAVQADVAMTGEITLRGHVLPIGGLKEKLIAAARGGIHTVIIPKENHKDLADIPKSIRQQITIIEVSEMSQVLPHALVLGKKDPLKKLMDQWAKGISA